MKIISQHFMASEDSPRAKGRRWTANHPAVFFIICCLLIQTLCMKSVETLNCSQPNTKSLLAAFRKNVFDMTEVRPVNNLQTPTNVSVLFTLYGILGVDEKAQLLDTFIWLRLIWKIEDLSWDPVECGTSRISLPRQKLWRPDIVINQFMDENNAPETFYVYVNNTGHVTDGIPYRVVSSCNLNIYTFPFDIQNCSYTFNSYKHNVLDIQLFFGRSVEETMKLTQENMETTGEWELIDIRATKPDIKNYDENTWDVLIFYIVLKRRATLYVVNLLVPSCFLITLDLFSFLLPPQNVDRSAFKMTLILGYTVFLLLMNDILPVTGNTMPLINVFFSICLALMVASLLETILITNMLCSSSNYRPLPRWARVLVLHYLARLVGLAKKASDQNPTAPENSLEITSFAPDEVTLTKFQQAVIDSMVQHMEPGLEELKNLSRDVLAIRAQVDKHFTNDPKTEEWIQVGRVIDRLLFGVYVLFITVSFVTILVIWLRWYSD